MGIAPLLLVYYLRIMWLKTWIKTCVNKSMFYIMHEQVEILITQNTTFRVHTEFWSLESRSFQGFSRSITCILSKSFSCPVAKLWKGHIKFQKSWLHIKFKDFSKTLFNFDQIQGLSRSWKWTKFFQGFSRFFKDVGALAMAPYRPL